MKIKNYSILEKIGEGANGLVYKAIQANTARIVAIKTIKLKEELSSQKKEEQLARFERETQLCMEIYHSNMVELIDYGCTENNQPYAVFEYIEGETLRALLLRRHHLTACEMGELMKQVLSVLICAHNKGIVHRDLKPQNIMVTEIKGEHKVKVLDFGIGAFLSDFQDKNYRNLTLTTDILGTPAYSAPEQLKGKALTVKSDLYSWGLIAIECLTGKPVMDGGSIVEILKQQLNNLNVQIPLFINDHDLGRLLRKILEKKPTKRASNAKDILIDFEQINLTTLVRDCEVSINELEEETITNGKKTHFPIKLEKQLTFMCFRLKLIPTKEGIDLEVWDEIQKEQVNFCKDIITRCGGSILGIFMDSVAISFGETESDSVSARRVSRTIIELLKQVKRRSKLLLKQYDVGLTIQIGVHTGVAVIQSNRLPLGNAANIAFDLSLSAAFGCVLVSAASKKILEPFLEFVDAERVDFFNKTKTTEAHRLIRGKQKETKPLTFKSWNLIKKSRKPILMNKPNERSKLIYEIKSVLHTRNFTQRLLLS